MDAPQGRIIQLDTRTRPAQAVVEVVSTMRCARCAAGKGCGAGLLGGDERPRRIHARVAGNADLREGDTVTVVLAPNDLLGAAVSAYALPLAGGLLFAALAWLLGLGDLQAAIVTLSGLVAGLAFSRWRLRRNDCLRRFTPVVTRRVESGP